MPLSLAVLAPNRAKDSFADTLTNPCDVPIESWYLGGHSLGGAMAALYVDQHPNQINGLVLWAAYPAESNDLSSENVRVLSVYASNDGVASEEERVAVADKLPAATTYVEITGGNHAQFGDYGKQSGDGIATISPEYQWDWVAYVTSEFINPVK
jgi:pimeloyl-ACP methyl ester carboxylesterase